MDFNHDNVRRVVEEDRLSNLPDELIHKILSSFEMKFVARTCVLSSRWKLLWTSMPYLNFSSGELACITPRTSSFSAALTTLHLSGVKLCGDLFSKCVNLKNLTLHRFVVKGAVEGFDIITPRLSNLMLINGGCSTKFMNLIAPQLENLTMKHCSIEYLNAPPGLSSFYYEGFRHPSFCSKYQFHSLNKVTISLYLRGFPYTEKDARKTIDMFQNLHSVRYLTLGTEIVECLSSFPDLLSHHPSPFSNLICLTIDSSMRDDAYKVKMSTEARNFFLENSPSATFTMIKQPKSLL